MLARYCAFIRGKRGVFKHAADFRCDLILERCNAFFLRCAFLGFLRLGLGDVLGKDRDDAGAPAMRRQHHGSGGFFAHAEYRLEHHNDKFARRVIVVEQDHLVERRTRELGFGFAARLDHGFVWHGLGSCPNNNPRKRNPHP